MEVLSAFSAHADAEELCRFVKGFEKLDTVCLVHGEPQALEKMREAVAPYCGNVLIPEPGEVFEFEFVAREIEDLGYWLDRKTVESLEFKKIGDDEIAIFVGGIKKTGNCLSLIGKTQLVEMLNNWLNKEKEILDAMFPRVAPEVELSAELKQKIEKYYKPKLIEFRREHVFSNKKLRECIETCNRGGVEELAKKVTMEMEKQRLNPDKAKNDELGNLLITLCKEVRNSNAVLALLKSVE